MLFPENMPMPVASFMYGIPGAGKDFFEKILARMFKKCVQKRVEDGSFKVVKLPELTIEETEELFSLMGLLVLQLSQYHLFLKGERGLYSGFLPMLDPDKLLPHFTQKGYNGKNPTLYGKKTYQTVLSIQQGFTRNHKLSLSQIQQLDRPVFHINHVYQDAPNNLEVRREQLIAASPGTFLIHVLVDTPLWKCEARNRLRPRTIEPDEFARCAKAPEIFEQLKHLQGDLGGMSIRIKDITPGDTLATNTVKVSRSDGYSKTFRLVERLSGVAELFPV